MPESLFLPLLLCSPKTGFSLIPYFAGFAINALVEGQTDKAPSLYRDRIRDVAHRRG